MLVRYDLTIQFGVGVKMQQDNWAITQQPTEIHPYKLLVFNMIFGIMHVES